MRIFVLVMQDPQKDELARVVCADPDLYMVLRQVELMRMASQKPNEKSRFTASIGEPGNHGRVAQFNADWNDGAVYTIDVMDVRTEAAP